MLIVEWKSNWNGCKDIYLHFKAAGFFSLNFNVSEAREPVLQFVCLWDCMFAAMFVCLDLRMSVWMCGAENMCVNVAGGEL